MYGRGGGWSFKKMSSTVLIIFGLFQLVVGGGLTLFSYLTRDAQTGQFFVWYKLIISGAVMTLAGWIWHQKENEPLI
jgi:hypothetical protein